VLVAVVSEVRETIIAHDSDIQRAALALKAMSHPIRLKILCAVAEDELSVQTIVDCVDTTQSNVSQHLARLRDKEIVASRRDANRIFYRVKDERTLRLVEMMRDVFCSSEQ
jgi:DNA-binding transcriptional ArsR family regulator